MAPIGNPHAGVIPFSTDNRLCILIEILGDITIKVILFRSSEGDEKGDEDIGRNLVHR